MNQLIKNFEDFLKSDEGKKHFDGYFSKMKRDKDRYEDRLKRFHEKHDDKFEEVVDKLIEKYDSDKYHAKERKLGYQARMPLFYFFHSYAEKYGRKVTEEEHKEHGNMFTSSIMVYRNYMFHIMHGQGSAILVFKV